MRAGRSSLHVVWDWNGTLLADAEAIVAASVVALDAVGAPTALDLARYRSTFRRPLRAFYSDLAGRPVGDEDWTTLTAAFRRHYGNAEPALPLATGAPAALDRLDAAGVGQSLLSLHVHDALVATLRRRGLHDRFARVDGNRLGADGKAAALAEHLAALDLAARSAVLVGDSLDDAAAAAAASTGCVLVAEHSTHHAEDLRAAPGPVPVVGTLREAVDVLTRADAR